MLDRVLGAKVSHFPLAFFLPLFFLVIFKSLPFYVVESEDSVSKMVRLLKLRSLEPVIVFSFSKKECEIYALKMADYDFNTPQEKSLVAVVFEKAIDGLSQEDRRLPQVESVLPLLKKGIGIHHGGLLPLLREVVELLFFDGLIKVIE